MRTTKPWSRVVGYFAIGAMTACTAVLDIEPRAGTWCATEGGSHAVCEDFDNSPAFAARWGAPTMAGGASAAPLSSKRSSFLAVTLPAREPAASALYSLPLKRRVKSLCFAYDIRLGPPDAQDWEDGNGDGDDGDGDKDDVVPPPQTGAVGLIATATVAFTPEASARRALSLSFEPSGRAMLASVSFDSSSPTVVGTPQALDGVVVRAHMWTRLTVRIESAAEGLRVTVTNSRGGTATSILSDVRSLGDALTFSVGGAALPPVEATGVSLDNVTVDPDCAR